MQKKYFWGKEGRAFCVASLLPQIEQKEQKLRKKRPFFYEAFFSVCFSAAAFFRLLLWQCKTSAQLKNHGLLRRCAPRNGLVLQRKLLRAKRSNPCISAVLKVVQGSQWARFFGGGAVKYLCLCCVVCCNFFGAEARAQAVPQTRYGDVESARVVKQAEAYLLALEKKHAALLRYKALSFGLKDTHRQQALVSALYKLEFEEILQEKSGKTEIKAHLQLKSKGRVSAEIQYHLKQESLLNLRSEWLSLLQKTAQEGKELLATTAAQKADTQNNAAFSERMYAVAQRLEALFFLGSALDFFQERWQEPHKAKTLLQEALRKDRSLSILWACLGEVQLQLDSIDAALDNVNTALTLENNRARALYIRGLIYLRLRQPSTAKVDFDAALALQPNTTAWLRARGAVHLLLEDFTLMCEDFAKACAAGDCEGLVVSRKDGHCL